MELTVTVLFCGGDVEESSPRAGAAAIERDGEAQQALLAGESSAARTADLDGLQATRVIAADPSLAAVRIVILTTFDLDEYVFDALLAGASGFLVKDAEPHDLLIGVRAVARGEALLAPRATKRLIEEFATRAKQPTPPPELDELTPRERETWRWSALGCPTRRSPNA